MASGIDAAVDDTVRAESGAGSAQRNPERQAAVEIGRAMDGPVAYLTGEYPLVSHTFIQREIDGVRRAGVNVLPCAIRRTDATHQTGPEERAAAAETVYVLALAKNPLRLVGAHLACLAAAPRRYLTALRLAVATAPPGLRAALYQVFYLAEAGVLARVLTRRGVRHLHNHFADSSCTVAMLASTLSGIPYSFSMHGPTEFFAAERWRLDVKIARARFVACISHFCRSQCMIFSAPSDWKKLEIVHCGVELARYGTAAARESTAESEDSRPVNLLFTGRLTPLKGAAVLIAALAQLKGPSSRPEAGGRPLSLTLVGDGTARADLERQTAELGLEKAVRFTGYQSQSAVAEHLAASDLFVLPSFAEGVPVVLMEAMASRVPVIASRVGGVGELVEDGVSGLVVAPSDVDGLAAAISRLAADPGLRRRFSEAGRAKVAAEFDIDTETARLAHLFAGETETAGGAG